VILHFALLLLFQLAGEVLSRLWAPQVPGPVLGLALFAAVLIGSPRLLAAVRPTVTEFLRHLSLLFVPAGVGVTVQLDRVAAEGVAIGVALLLSTAAGIAAGALVFRWTARLTGAGDG
jgi:holin-like protein